MDFKNDELSFKRTFMKNSKGQVFYGLHFYPGLAEYKEADGSSYRVYLNENTLRKMDPSFAGKPIFVEHVDDVDPDLDKVKQDADGWVVESFYNTADGKHWVKFIIVSEQGLKAVKNGMRLSNAYIPKHFAEGGLWNGISYQREITDGEYEHLAIVNDPRYEESIIMTPEEFKKHNEDKLVELKKLSNSKNLRGDFKMKFNFFKRTKVENAIDPDLQITLPSGKTLTVGQIIQNAFEKEEKETKKEDKKNVMADPEHMVKMKDGSSMSVKDMMEKHQSMKDELESMKSKKKDEKEEELEVKSEKSAVDVEGDLKNEPDSEHDMDKHEMEVAREESKASLKDDLDHPEDVVHDEKGDQEMDESDESAKKKALQLVEHEQAEIEEKKKKDSKKKNDASIKAERLKNAHLNVYKDLNEGPTIELSDDRVARGKQRYGS